MLTKECTLARAQWFGIIFNFNCPGYMPLLKENLCEFFVRNSVVTLVGIMKVFVSNLYFKRLSYCICIKSLSVTRSLSMHIKLQTVM